MALQATDINMAILIFCRLGTCLMIMPGLSSMRVPMRVRLLIALMLSITLVPLEPGGLRALASAAQSSDFLQYVVTECLIGGFIGFLGRLYFGALQFAATAAANFIGLGQISGLQVVDADPVPQLATIMSLAATMLMFLLDLHWEVIRALLASYTAMPPSTGFDQELAIISIIEGAGRAFLLTLRITSPFLVYAIVVNVAVGVSNKLQPNMPVFFVSMPFVIFGGLLLTYFTLPEMLVLFEDYFANWLRNG